MLGNNTPLADLMVISPEKCMFLIDVKGLAAKNYWRIMRKEARHDLFYVLALVPRGASNEFFIMTQEAVNGGIADEFSRLRPEQKALGEKAYTLLGLRWRDAEPFINRWDILPA
jgi:hypothetical protein